MTEEFSRGKPQLRVTTMGHAGHGKTTLTAAINYVLSMKSMINGSALKALAARSAEDPWARKVIDLVASLDTHIVPSETRALSAPRVTQAPQSIKAPQATEAPKPARSPGAVPSFTERLRDLFGRKRQE